MTQIDFSSLNEKQLEAVNSIDGPVLIIAGPGTGKTTVLTYRIANILKVTDTKPQSILAMTFTEAGVYAMKTKLVSLIGADAYKVEITTIHGFCNSVIQDFPEFFMEIAGFAPLSDLEKIQISKELLEDEAFVTLAPTGKPDMYLLTLPRVISTLKREYITPKKLDAAIEVERTTLESINKYVTRGPNKGNKLTDEYQKQQSFVQKLEELSVFYKKYNDMLVARKRYDYDDMVLSVLECLESEEELLSSVQEKYQYFLVDEYQDTNDAQNALLFKLAEYWGESANFFAVGDDDQSIYRFQGASVKNIKDFLDRYPNAKIITLKENYRSQQSVLDVSREFIRNNTSSLEKILENVDKQLVSRAKIEPTNINLVKLESYVGENMFIADEIKKLEKTGTILENLAVLVRDNRDMDDLIDIFQRKQIAYVRRSGNDVLKNKYVKQLINILTVVAGVIERPSNDGLLYSVLHYPYFSVPKVDIIKLARDVSKERDKNLWDYVFAENQEEQLTLLNVSNTAIQKVKGFFDQITSWATESELNTLGKIMEIVINESGLLNYILKLDDKFQELNALNSFYTEVKNLNTSKPDITLKEFITTIELMQDYNITMKERDIGLVKGGVNIITAHSSKGLEFDYVFIPKMYYRKWDNKTVRDMLPLPETLLSTETTKVDTLEEERRLFYVALTRARNNVYLSNASKYNDDYSGKEKDVTPSQFLSELPPKLVTEVDVTDYQANLPGNIGDLLKTNPYDNVYINTVEEKEVLKAILGKYKLSPTDLNTYLYCPMQFLLKVVLRTPSAIAPVMVYGNAYHKALELYYQQYMRTNEPMQKSMFVTIFKNELDRYPLTAQQKAKLSAKGEKNLNLYYEYIANQKVSVLKTEHKISFVQLNVASLNGRIDRIDALDAEKKLLCLCDYKTGASLSQSELEKSVTNVLRDNDKGQRYYNQLMFYKVLSEIDPYIGLAGRTAVEGTLIFVDPEKESFVERKIEYKHQDVEDMKHLIIETWQKIQALDFPRIHNHPNDTCEFCKIGL